MSGQRRTWYTRLYGSEPGIDPYTRAVSDVYQDLFNEGSFVGKGIYDVDAFEQSLGGRFPENSILSHDLLEGCYARAGLVSDIQLYEGYPSRYAADVKRRHRWIRGDWQLLPWLLPSTPRTDGSREPNPLSTLSQGKVLDNLRRSLVPAAMVSLLLMGWLLAPAAGAWTLWVLSILLVPPSVASFRDFFARPVDVPLGAHFKQAGAAIVGNYSRVPLTLACLPFEAFFSLDAILRTLWRLVISGRHLLQWSPSSEVERNLDDGLGASFRLMWSAPVAAIATTIALVRFHPSALPVAGPILLLWLLSPAIMWWLGLPRMARPADLSSQQRHFLGRLARRTWSFFETWVTEADHWLPPDNVQEHPALQVAHRTSPTNIGLSLLANLSAYDFGYLQTGGVIGRTAPALATLQSLPRHRGHFYNWYDTQTLQPLPPHYVSTVDSGNLAGHLLTLRQGLLALIDAPVLAASTWEGLSDTLGLLRESLPEAMSMNVLVGFEHALDDVLTSPVHNLQTASAVVDALLGEATRIHEALIGQPGEAAHWAASLVGQCLSIQQELQLLAPWASANPGVVGTPSTTRPHDGIPSLRDLAAIGVSDLQPAQQLELDQAATAAAQARIIEIGRLADIAGECAQMDFVFLYDRSRHLLSIGYNVTEHRRDTGYYDLLASEARLANFVAIAQNQLPQESWFSLGRLLTEVGGDAGLLSWSGSMFEYLMPQLVMPSYEGTLLDQTGKAAVQRQIDYGQQRRVPWGISESGYNMVDAGMNYQYRAFGVPGLGLRRGLADDLVIAPYASMMALMVAPEAACANLQRLTEAGFGGRHGLYEAIDYTPQRQPRGQDHVVVRSYMAHHQGMGLLSLDYLLRGQPMQQRFTADPEFQATLLLLQERIPRTGAFHPHSAEATDADAGGSAGARIDETRLRVFRDPTASRPGVQMLSNGRYHVMVSNAGGGYSRSGDLAVTRWRSDATRDHWGSFCYLRDVDSGEFWSTAHQPTTVPVDGYEAIFSDAKIEFRGRKHGFETHLEIAVSPEDDIELRRLKLINRSRKSRTIEITTYAEVVLAPGIADELHPAFSNLFVQTELLPQRRAIICTRRPRALHDTPPWMFHLMQVHDAGIDAVSYETDRARFVGRGNDLRRPQALIDPALSGSQGSVLDPVVAIRCRITLAPEQKATVDMVTGVSANREDCSGLIDKYRDRRLADRVFDLAWTHSEVVRRQINASQSDAQLYEHMAGLVIYAHQALRAEPSILLQNRRGQSGLWGQAISGDHPIVLLQIADPDNIELVRQMVQAHAYWRLKGLTVDLVILNEDQGGYRQQLQDQIMGLISASVEGHVVDRPGGIFARAAHQLQHDERILLQSVSRVIVSDALGKLADQLRRRINPEPAVALLTAGPVQYELMPTAQGAHRASTSLVGHGNGDDPADVDSWPFDPVVEPIETGNGLGGFSADGCEYVIDLRAGQTTPAPWANVLANPDFGTVVSESSAGYTWAENAHEFRLTPWHDDPVTDASGEAFYLRDEDDGRVWSPQPLPARGEGSYRTRHGFGYSVYEHVEDGIASELWVFVSATDAIKYSVLKLRNVGARRRRLSVTGYVEWILGDLHANTRMHVVSERDGESGALTARNPYNTEFSGRMAFFDVDAPDADPAQRSFTTDRAEFLGHNGTTRAPDSLLRERLSDRLGVGMDPCAAIM
ncbi:MAG: glucoamylase family protein, partial [Thermomonas sp.]